MKKKIWMVSLSFLVLMIAFLIFIMTQFRLYGYYEYGTYDDFAVYQSDFEAMKDIMLENGTGSYVICSPDSDAITGSDLSIRRMEDNREVILSAEEKEQLAQIWMHSYGYEHNLDSFVWISVTEDSVFFEYDAIGCGIMYTQNIRSRIAELEEGGERFGYRKFAKGWYGIYR